MKKRQRGPSPARQALHFMHQHYADLSEFALGDQKSCPYCGGTDRPVIQSATAGLACPCCGGKEQTEVERRGFEFDPLRSVTVILACQRCGGTWSLFVDLSIWVAAAVVPEQVEHV